MARKPRAVVQTTPASYSVPKVTLALAVAEATDYVTATAGNASGIASFEFKWGTETGVYGDPVACPRNFMDIYAETEALFVVCRGIAFDGSIGEWSDEATISIAKNDFVSFEFPESSGSAVINSVAHTIAVNVEPETVKTALVAEFTVSDGASVLIGSTEQESGVTENDFTNPVVYKVVSRDEVEQEWTVTVTVLESPKDFLTFTIPTQVGASVIDAEAHTIGVTMPDDTNPAALVATFTMDEDATCKVGVTVQESGVTANDFTNPVTYKAIGKDLSEQNWVVTVTVLKDAGKAITAFGLAGGQVGETVINEGAGTIALSVAHGTDPSALIATFTNSAESAVTVGEVAQESGVTANDFTNPVVYRVTAEDETYKEYTVTITVNPATNNFTAFSVPTGGSATIDANAHTVAVTVPHGTDETALIATFSLTAGASADISDVPQESGVTENNFSAPVVYTITGADAAEQNWTVTISKAAATNHITAFSMAEQTGAATINATAHTVAIEVAALTDVDHLVATFTLTAGASAKVGNTVQVSGDTQNDFTAPVVYAVTGADEVTQNWTVTVTVAA